MARSRQPTVISLSDGTAQVDILPEQGAAIARYDLVGDAGRLPLFRPTPFGPTGRAFDVGSILLIPWSNRISGGGFEYDGRFVRLEPNLDGEPYPIHGNAFQLPWSLVGQDRTTASLVLDSSGPADFRYAAEVLYELSGGGLHVELSVVNRGQRAMPFGLGVHPWLPRTPATTLQFNAKEVWLEDDRHLPAGRLDLAREGEWDFSEARALPERWINNVFGGWDGCAQVIWPERNVGLRIEAAPVLRHCVVYSPCGSSPFFCFEPVSHSVDAHNRPGREASHLTRLEPGETLRAWCRFEPGYLDQRDRLEGLS